MIEEVSRLFDVQVQLEAAEIPAGIKHYVVDTWCDPGKFLAAGSLPIFAHHGENLRFIHWALTAMARTGGSWSKFDGPACAGRLI